MIKHRKMRFFLTVLGIVIGIAAVVGLISIGQGMEGAITESFESFGVDKIIILGGSFQSGSMGFGQTLTSEDVENIKSMRGVEKAFGMSMKILPIEYKNEVKSTYVSGLPPEEAADFFLESKIFELADGTVKENDKYSTVIGSKVASGLFERDIQVGDTIIIKDTKFKVSGILQSTGSPQDDAQLIISLDTYGVITGDGSDDLMTVIVQVENKDNVNDVAEDIEKELNDKYGEDSFSAMTSEQLAKNIGDIFSIISIVLGGIASVSLLVAGVGIANTMYMSVLERTKEVGVMKAIGATDLIIMEIFLVESAVIGAIGGFVGAIFGVVISYSINAISEAYVSIPLKASVSPILFISGVLFAILVSVLFGLIPARKASKLNPVDALRYE